MHLACACQLRRNTAMQVTLGATQGIGLGRPFNVPIGKTKTTVEPSKSNKSRNERCGSSQTFFKMVFFYHCNVFFLPCFFSTIWSKIVVLWVHITHTYPVNLQRPPTTAGPPLWGHRAQPPWRIEVRNSATNDSSRHTWCPLLRKNTISEAKSSKVQGCQGWCRLFIQTWMLKWTENIWKRWMSLAADPVQGQSTLLVHFFGGLWTSSLRIWPPNPTADASTIFNAKRCKKQVMYGILLHVCFHFVLGTWHIFMDINGILYLYAGYLCSRNILIHIVYFHLYIYVFIYIHLIIYVLCRPTLNQLRQLFWPFFATRGQQKFHCGGVQLLRIVQRGPSLGMRKNKANHLGQTYPNFILAFFATCFGIAFQKQLRISVLFCLWMLLFCSCWIGIQQGTQHL